MQFVYMPDMQSFVRVVATPGRAQNDPKSTQRKHLSKRVETHELFKLGDLRGEPAVKKMKLINPPRHKQQLERSASKSPHSGRLTITKRHHMALRPDNHPHQGSQVYLPLDNTQIKVISKSPEPIDAVRKPLNL